jgi:deazaflavin-dependent oxidoreductase (nitroreductase family)
LIENVGFALGQNTAGIVQVLGFWGTWRKIGRMVPQKNLLQRINTGIAMSAVGARLSARVMHHLDKLVLRLSNGRSTAASLLTGLPILALTTTGAKSGQPRTTPLVAIPFGENQLVIIASNWGQQKHPAWYYNILAHPQVTVTRDGRSQPYLARVTEGVEREACWQTAVQTYPGYNAYKQRTTRQIPVILLTPAANTDLH